MSLKLEQDVEINDDIWRINSMVYIRDLNGQIETYCHLVSTTRTRDQIEGAEPLQAYAWVPGSKFEPDVQYVKTSNPEIHLRLSFPEAVWLIKKPGFGNEWVVAEDQLQFYLNRHFDIDSGEIECFKYRSISELLKEGNEISLSNPQMG